MPPSCSKPPWCRRWITARRRLRSPPRAWRSPAGSASTMPWPRPSTCSATCMAAPASNASRFTMRSPRGWATARSSDTQMAQAIAAEMTALAAQGVSHVPGFGHRFHPRDPRAPRLLELVDIAAPQRRGERPFRRHRARARSAAGDGEGTAHSDEYRRRHRRRVRGARLSAAALPGAVRPVALGRAPWRMPSRRCSPASATKDPSRATSFGPILVRRRESCP